MSVTNTTIFNLTRNEIMDASARVTGYLGAGETLSVEDQTNRSQALNIMVKSWATRGLDHDIQGLGTIGLILNA